MVHGPATSDPDASWVLPASELPATTPRRGRTQGAQAIDRTAAILRIIASHGRVGASLRQVTVASKLHKPTAYRILRALIDNGLVEYLTTTRSFRLGFEIFALNAAMGEQFDLRTLAQPALDRLARASEDTSYLAIRSGHDGLCLAISEGDFPQKALRLSVGARWPLGVGALNLAMLSFLPDEEVDETIAHNAEILEAHEEYAPAAIYRYVAETRQRGYAVKASGAFPTMCGVSVPIFDIYRRPFAALSVIAIAPRMEPQRRDWIADLLWRESRQISDVLKAQPAHDPRSDYWRPGSPRRITGWVEDGTVQTAG